MELEEAKKFLNNMCKTIKENKMFFDEDTIQVKIGIKTQQALETVLHALEEVTEERNDYRSQINSAFNNGFIPKKKIEHDLEVCQNVYKKEMKPYQTEYGLDVTYLSKKEKQELVNKRNCLITQMETYKQLLEEK